MNVFYLDHDPDLCAQYHCDKHVVKMIIEYAQLMSTAHRMLDGEEWIGRNLTGRRIRRFWHPDPVMNEHLYKACHYMHPSAVWTRASKANYDWLYSMWASLCEEYTYRYGRTHLSQEKLQYYLLFAPANASNDAFTQPTPAMSHFPQCIVEGDSLTSYRNYYYEAKQSFVKWTGRDVPEWYKLYERQGKQTETLYS